jgi:hypothetical protein
MLQCHKDKDNVSFALVQESLIIEEALTADSSTKRRPADFELLKLQCGLLKHSAIE